MIGRLLSGVSLGRLIGIAVALVLLAGGLLAAYERGVADATAARGPTVVRVSQGALQDSLETLELRNEGLLARLRNVEELQPAVIVTTDTLWRTLPLDTALSGVRVEGGELSIGRYRRETQDTVSGWRGELLRGVRIEDCETWSVGARGILCDRPELGRIGLLARAGASGPLLSPTAAVGPRGELGIWLDRSRASPWRLEVVATTEQRLQVALTWEGPYAWW